MLPVPLDWPFLIAHSAFSNVYLKLNCMLLEKPKGAIKNGQFREIKGYTKQIMIRPAAIQQVDKPFLLQSSLSPKKNRPIQ
jgi:hypothetical protein